ncbi:hypothetical protein [Streptomyces lunaelactis]|nr:hypothetical protein [Streptomyces lunaelactis]
MRATTMTRARGLGQGAHLEWPRAVAPRYDRLAVRYEANVLVAAINEWL